MDASRFDAWTRRRFGLVAGGSIASLAGLSTLADSEAKKKRKRKKVQEEPEELQQEKEVLQEADV